MRSASIMTSGGTRPAIRRMRAQRGVSSVLAMMFLVLFGSLAVCMAVVAQGNLRTADSALKVSRAMSAAETGMVFAQRRLDQQARRFVVRRGLIDAEYGEGIWLGTLEPGQVTVLPPIGYVESAEPIGVMHAVRYLHANIDDHAFDADLADEALPSMDEVLGILLTKPIRMSPIDGAPYFRLRYELLADPDRPMIRVTSEGIDGDIRRSLQVDFQITKRIEYAILSPNRIMIGKNVMVEGPLGSTYGLDAGDFDGHAHAHPIVMRSDFYYLDPALDAKLDALYAAIRAGDVDGDSRLRPGHPVEGAALAGDEDLVDADDDFFVDDFDLFLAHFDEDSNGMLVYDADLAAAAGLGSLTVDPLVSALDPQLLRLIDESRPDRDGDGIPGSPSDRMLGWRDGVIDGRDLYGKVVSNHEVTGRLMFSVAREVWEAAHGGGFSYQDEVQGPIRPRGETPPVSFQVPAEQLLVLDTSMFDDSRTWFEDQVEGSPDFLTQAAPGLTPVSGSTPWEPVPFGAPGAYDYYQRPRIEDVTFTNVLIPMGTNALFVNCTFVGVTFIESESECTHPNWNYVGAVEPSVDDPNVMVLRFDAAGFQPVTIEGVAGEISDTRAYSNNLRFHNCTFLGSIAGDRIAGYTHWRNKIQMTGNSRFYLDPEDLDLLEQDDADDLVDLLNGIDEEDRLELAKSSMMLPGWSVDVGNFNNEVGESPADTPRIKLRGTIIAGILDIRGTADLFGTMLMTFRPMTGQPPLIAVDADGVSFPTGTPDRFNTTVGYFGELDGDGEGAGPGDDGFEGFGEIRLRYDPEALLPDGIPWPIRIEAVPNSYREGGVG